MELQLEFAKVFFYFRDFVSDYLEYYLIAGAIALTFAGVRWVMRND